jgi:hypothetical protein
MIGGIKMCQQDAKTIDSLCEAIYETAVEHKIDRITKFKIDSEPSTRLVFSSVMISVERLHANLRDAITSHIERQVISFYRDLGAVVKFADDPERGRCICVNLPPELRGVSWESIIRRQWPRKI